MLQIAHSSFYIETPQRSTEELEELAVTVFREYERLAATGLSIDDFSIEFVLENGSIEGEGWIWASGAFLFHAVCNYGSFCEGVKKISDHSRAVGRAIAKKAPSLVGAYGAKKSYTSTAGDLDVMQSIFEQVKRGTLDTEKAAIKILALFESKGEPLSDAAANEVRGAITTLKPYPRQQTLPTIEDADRYSAIGTVVSTETKRLKQVQETAEELRVKVRVRREARGQPEQVEVLTDKRHVKRKPPL